MSDPLSLFAEQDDDIERLLDEEVSPNDKIANRLEDEKMLATKEVFVDDSRQENVDTQQLEQTISTQEIHNISGHPDLLMQIEEEIGSLPRDIVVVVENPEKVVKTIESYVAFTVKTKTTRSEFEDPEYSVKRRYNDFLWLRQQLEEKYPYLIVPPLPEKQSLTIDRFDKEFLLFRQVALGLFVEKIVSHPLASHDAHVKAFLSLEYNEFQNYKKKGTGLLSRVTKSITTIGGSYMLKNRPEEYVKMYDYITAFGERMGAFERISTRLLEEQNDYMNCLGGNVTAYQEWEKCEDKLSPTLKSMSELNEVFQSSYKEMVDCGVLKVLLPLREYAIFSEAIKGVLARRDALQHESEIISEELSNAQEEKKQLDAGQTGGGFLGRNLSDDAIQVKKERLDQRLKQLDDAHNQLKEKLEARNKNVNIDMERWHFNKKVDMKQLISGVASRNIEVYDKHIQSLEGTLNAIREHMVA